MAEEVSVIVHCAATVKFDENLQRAVKLNTKATQVKWNPNKSYCYQALVEYARSFKKLDALVHVSTAYSNCHR